MQNRPKGSEALTGWTRTAWYDTQWLPTNPTEGAHISFGSQPDVLASHGSLLMPHGTLGKASLP